MKRVHLILPIIIFAILLAAYFPILNWFFARDDFGFLPQIPTTLQNLSVILIPPRIWFFRPLSQQFYFWLGTEIWGLSAVWFRVTALGLLTLNSLLIYKLIRRFGPSSAATFGLIFYGLNTLHLFEIGWVAANYQTITTTLFLTTILFATSQNHKYRLFSFLTMFLAFLASEMSIFIFPVIVVYIASSKLTGKLVNWSIDVFSIIKQCTPYGLLTVLYLLFYLSYVHLPGGSVYGRYLDVTEMLRLLAKYLLYPFVAGFDRTNFLSIVNIILATKASLIVVITAWSFSKKNINSKLLSYGVLWFLITVSLFTLLKGHSFSYLDAIPAVGLTLIIASLWPASINKQIQTALLVTLAILSLLSLRLTQTTDPDLNWLYAHQLAAKTAYEEIKVSGTVTLNEANSDQMEATYFGKLIPALFKTQSITVYWKP